MSTSLAIVIVAFGFGGVTYIVEQGERRASTCPVHDRKAGKMARVLGILCGVIAAGLLVAAILLRDL